MRLEDVYDAKEWQRRLAAVLMPRYVRMLEAWQGLVSSALPQLQAEDFRLDDEATRAILAEAAERVVLIDAATRDAIREQLREGQKRGYSSYEIANGVPGEDYRGIDGLFAVTWKGRAETVAFNELAEAQHLAALDRYRATGLVEKVQLVENEDTDEPCASRNGKIVPLSSNPKRLHVNCRLGLVPVVEDVA